MATTVVRVARPRKQWSTLQLLRTARLTLLLLDVLLLMAVVSATEASRATLQTVGKDAAPSIIAAQRIRSAVSGMDAQLAGELIANSGGSAASVARYNTERGEAAMALLSAAENITYGDAERRPIRLLQNGLASYEELAERSRDLHDLEHDPGSATAGPVLNAYREAETMTDNTLLPAAEDLDLVNNSVLEDTYRSDQLRSTWARVLIVASALATLAVLLATQMMLSRRMHRTFNPALLIATVLTAILSVHAFRAVSASHEELRRAKEDAFHSVRTLWQARAAAFAAERDAARALVDTTKGAAHEQSFTRHAEAVAEAANGLTTDQLVAALREGREIQGFSGYLAEELRNATYPGEKEAALEAVSDWETYLGEEQQVRRLEHTGQHRRAAELATAAQNRGPEAAFERFDRALGNALGITEGAFNAAVADGFGSLRGLEAEASVMAVQVGLLVFAGFAPRLREYR